MLNKIKIDKSLIPYSFDILLANDMYSLFINYNETIDIFTIDVSKGEEKLINGEPIIFGLPLFIDTYKEGFPYQEIIAFDESKVAEKVTFDNFNETVNLCIFDEGVVLDD